MGMKRSVSPLWNIVSGSCLLHLVCSLAPTTPLSPLTDRLPLSQADVTDLNVPAAFKVELFRDSRIPIDSNEIYRAATDMMVEVTGRPLMEPWLDRDWRSPIGDSGIYIQHSSYGKDPSRLYTQYLIWGLNHILLSMTLSDSYCQTTATLKYRGAPVGEIHIVKRPPGGQPWSTQEPSALMTFNQQTPGSLAYVNFEIKIAYGAKPVPKKIIYLTAIKAMGEACEKGLSAVLPGMFTRGIREVIWKLIGMSQSGRMIEAGYSRMAVIKTLARMVSEEHFSETFVWAKVDGRAAGIGGFTQGIEKGSPNATS
ncbi:MAG: hypothetical protein LQ349_001207 [Xanthoria aureola]|nr:MAG: hypothetical protein LQ349_001207 [Xanthoria aureola]